MSPDVETSIANLREKVIEVEGAVNTMQRELAQVDKYLHVTKHDVANMKMTLDGFILRVDKIEERLGAKIDVLTTSITNLNVKHEKGASFFAGVAFIIVSCGALLMGIGKLLFSR